MVTQGRRPTVLVLQEGRIYFLYRPRAGRCDSHSLSNVDRFFIILEPLEDGDGAAYNRLVVVGKRRMPKMAIPEHVYTFIMSVSRKLGNLTHILGPKDEAFKKQSAQEAARVLGIGDYAIVDHGEETRLKYKLLVPEEPGRVQLDFFIGRTGSYTINVKNPKPEPEVLLLPRAGMPQKADYPQELKQMFEGKPRIPVKDPQLLNFKGAEVLLASDGKGPAPPQPYIPSSVAPVSEEEIGRAHV